MESICFDHSGKLHFPIRSLKPSMSNAPRLPLNTLIAFRAVAELENLRAAAEAMHLTHSAVSQQIRGLEEQLGFALFDRRGRRVVLNAAGQALLRSVQSALALLDDGVQAAAAAAGGAAQRLRVTVLPSFANRWLMPRMSRWRERHPDLPLEIEASIRVVDLQREGFHAAVRQGKGPWAGLDSERLWEQPPIIIVGSPSAARRLQGAQHAAGRRSLASRCSATTTCGTTGLPRRDCARTCERWPCSNDAGLMLQAAEQNLGLALSRDLLAADALREVDSCGCPRSRSCPPMRFRTISCIHRGCARGRRSLRFATGYPTSSTARATN